MCLCCSDVGYEEKRVNLIRRIDFAWAVEKDDPNKKQKKTTSKDTAAPWQWQSVVENLHLAHQELSVIIDLINTVSHNFYSEFTCILLFICILGYSSLYFQREYSSNEFV